MDKLFKKAETFLRYSYLSVGAIPFSIESINLHIGDSTLVKTRGQSKFTWHIQIPQGSEYDAFIDIDLSTANSIQRLRLNALKNTLTGEIITGSKKVFNEAKKLIGFHDLSRYAGQKIDKKQQPNFTLEKRNDSQVIKSPIWILPIYLGSDSESDSYIDNYIDYIIPRMITTNLDWITKNNVQVTLIAVYLAVKYNNRDLVHKGILSESTLSKYLKLFDEAKNKNEKDIKFNYRFQKNKRHKDFLVQMMSYYI